MGSDVAAPLLGGGCGRGSVAGAAGVRRMLVTRQTSRGGPRAFRSEWIVGWLAVSQKVRNQFSRVTKERTASIFGWVTTGVLAEDGCSVDIKVIDWDTVFFSCDGVPKHWAQRRKDK